MVTNLSMYSLIFASSGLSALCDIVGRLWSGDQPGHARSLKLP
jgi:hypothetical protein